MEPHNQKDRCDVCVRKDGEVVGHIEKGRSGRLFFLRSDATGSCRCTVTGKAVNLGDKEGQNIPGCDKKRVKNHVKNGQKRYHLREGFNKR